MITEQFETAERLYYYTNLTTTMQIHDQQVYQYKIKIDGQIKHVLVINYDLHHRRIRRKVIYGIIIPNDDEYINKNTQWSWKTDEYLTASQINRKYGIKENELPKSSQRTEALTNQLNIIESKEAPYVDSDIIDNTNWFNILQIGTKAKEKDAPKVTVVLSKELWIKACKISFVEETSPLIPIVLAKRDKHWIEWIKIVYIKSQNIHIGVCLRYMNNEWKVSSLCLDRGDIMNKHRLTGLNRRGCAGLFKNFRTSIDEIEFVRNPRKHKDRQVSILKEQREQLQRCIIKQKETMLRLRNEKNQINTDELSNTLDIDHAEFLENDEIISEPEDCDDLDQKVSDILDEAMKWYEVNAFATHNISIKSDMIQTVMEKVKNERFKNNNDLMYRWLDYTATIQMIQEQSKVYSDANVPGKFVLAVVNYELQDRSGEDLYGVILMDEKDSYKLHEILTQDEICKTYGILPRDLPKKSRKQREFKEKLLIKRKIRKSDIEKMELHDLDFFKSQSVCNPNDVGIKTVTLTENILKDYINISIERLHHNENQFPLIPVLVCDKYNEYYRIEWVLVINIIHSQCNIGISFYYNNEMDSYQATGIYLDKLILTAHHKLTGLQHDYCIVLHDFAVRGLEFKGKISVISDDAYDGEGKIEESSHIQGITGQPYQYINGTAYYVPYVPITHPFQHPYACYPPINQPTYQFQQYNSDVNNNPQSNPYKYVEYSMNQPLIQ